MSKQASRSHLPQARIADSSSRNAVSFSSAPIPDDGQHPPLCSVDFENLKSSVPNRIGQQLWFCRVPSCARIYEKARPEKALPIQHRVFGSDTRRTSFLTQIVVRHAIDCKLSTVGRVASVRADGSKKASSRGFTDV